MRAAHGMALCRHGQVTGQCGMSWNRSFGSSGDSERTLETSQKWDMKLKDLRKNDLEGTGAEQQNAKSL